MFRNIELRRISAVSIAAIALGLTACNRETADAAPPAGAAKAAEAERRRSFPTSRWPTRPARATSSTR